MKKILSLTLVLAMVMSMGITTAFAAGNWEGGTTVTYSSTGTESWTVTVPASLTPGNAGDVTAAGTWGSNRKLVVTADDSVKLTNSINSADYKDLAVTFADINLVGDNTKAVSETKQVSVAAMTEDALFGTWSGTFYYDVEMVNMPTEPYSVSLEGPGAAYLTASVVGDGDMICLTTFGIADGGNHLTVTYNGQDCPLMQPSNTDLCFTPQGPGVYIIDGYYLGGTSFDCSGTTLTFTIN